MDSLISHHIDRLKKRLHNSRLLTSSHIDKITQILSEFESKAESLNDEEFSESISSLFQEISLLEPLKKICQEHRDTYTHLARIGKESEKFLNFNLEDLKAHQSEKFDKTILNQIFSNYLVSQGLLTQASMLNGLNLNPECEIYETIEHIRSGNLDSALDSACKLGTSSRSVQFHIHKLKYVNLVKSNDTTQAVNYAREHLSQFSDKHIEEIKHLMCACLYVSNPLDSAYCELFGEGYSQVVIQDILKEFSRFSELPSVQEIQTLLKAGQQAAPQILPLAQISSRIWTNPLPAEIRLTQDLKFHSTFVCPVSKEVATENNPPIMLPCGHLIAKATMDRLLAGTVRLKFKCPTCPIEATDKDSKQIFI